MFNFLKKIKNKLMSCCGKKKQGASGTSSNTSAGTQAGKSMDKQNNNSADIQADKSTDKQTSKGNDKQTANSNTNQTAESMKKHSSEQAGSQAKISASGNSSSQTSKDTHDKKQSVNTSARTNGGESKNIHGKDLSPSAKRKTSAASQKENEFIGAPLEGEVVSIQKVSDPTFSQEMLGKGVAIIPSIGKVFSPVNGKISMIFDTKHALTITSDKGTEVLIHVGLDTVTLKGKPFTAHAKQNDTVKKGDLLLEFDMEAIKAAGLDTITPVVICNSDEYKEIIRYTDKIVNTGTTVMELVKE